jgi:hypothetical protein
VSGSGRGVDGDESLEVALAGGRISARVVGLWA